MVPGADVLLVHLCVAVTAWHNSKTTVRMEAVSPTRVTLARGGPFGVALSSLNLDLPILSEKVHGERLTMIAALAMLPAVLEAAEHVELVQVDPSLLATAMRAWHIPWTILKQQ